MALIFVKKSAKDLPAAGAAVEQWAAERGDARVPCWLRGVFWEAPGDIWHDGSTLYWNNTEQPFMVSKVLSGPFMAKEPARTPQESAKSTMVAPVLSHVGFSTVVPRPWRVRGDHKSTSVVELGSNRDVAGVTGPVARCSPVYWGTSFPGA